MFAGNTPVVGKGPNVDTTAHAARSAKNLLAFKDQVQSAVAAHAKPGNCPAIFAGDSFLICIYPLHQFHRNIGFILPLRFNRAVKIPARKVSVWANN